MSEEMNKKKGPMPIGDEEMDKVTGGGMGQMIEAFRPKTYYCRYCDKKFSSEASRDTHEKTCVKNPAITGGTCSFI